MPTSTRRAQENAGATAQDAPGQPLMISAEGGTWIVQGKFSGRVSVEPASIKLRFDKSRLALREGVAATTKRRIVSITPCLATKADGAPFTIVRRGLSLAVGRDVAVGQGCDVEAFASSIALDNTVDLPQHWLVLEIEMARANPDGTTGPSFVFIQSGHDVSAPKP